MLIVYWLHDSLIVSEVTYKIDFRLQELPYICMGLMLNADAWELFVKVSKCWWSRVPQWFKSKHILRIAEKMNDSALLYLDDVILLISLDTF